MAISASAQQALKVGLASNSVGAEIAAILNGTNSNDQTFSGNVSLGGAASTVGFFGSAGTVIVAAYTQTYATATRTHSNPTATALTVTDGVGTNDGTIGAITNNATTITAVQELAAAINAIIIDLANTKQVLNSVIDDLQGYHLAQ